MDKIRICKAVEWKGKLWFSNATANGLYYLEGDEAFFVDFFPDEKVDEKLIHRKAFINNDKIYFAPSHGSHIHIYDGATIESVDISTFKMESAIFFDATISGNNIFFLPTINSSKLIRFNADNNEVSYAEEFEKACDEFNFSHSIKNNMCKQFVNVGGRDNIIQFIYDCRWVLEWEIGQTEFRIINDLGEDTSSFFYENINNEEWAYVHIAKLMQLGDGNREYVLPNIDAEQSVLNCIYISDSRYFIYNGLRGIFRVGDSDFEYIDIDSIYGKAENCGEGVVVEYEMFSGKAYVFCPARDEIIIIDKNGNIEALIPKVQKENGIVYQKKVFEKVLCEGTYVSTEQMCSLESFLELVGGVNEN